jgi:hypothetical protein
LDNFFSGFRKKKIGNCRYWHIAFGNLLYGYFLLKPIDQEAIKEFYSWQKTGKIGDIPRVKIGEYFDQITGEPIVWYSERDGKIFLFSLPGHDPLTGNRLKPVTKEIASRFKERTTSPLEKIDFKKLSKFNLDWYLRALPSHGVSSEASYVYHKRLNEEVPYVVYVESVFFDNPKHTIFGVCYKVDREAYPVIEIDKSRSIIDSNGTKHEINRVITDDNSLRYSLTQGEIKRALYVSEYISPEKLRNGGIFLESLHVPIKFSL